MKEAKSWKHENYINGFSKKISLGPIVPFRAQKW